MKQLSNFMSIVFLAFLAIIWFMLVYGGLADYIFNILGAVLVGLAILIQPLIHIIFRAWF
jgi:hypothetical protein